MRNPRVMAIQGNVYFVDFQNFSPADAIRARIADIEAITPMLTHYDELNDKFELNQELKQLKSKLNEINNLGGGTVIFVDFKNKRKAA